MQIIFEQMRVGGDRNFGYLLGDRDKKQAVLIDPSYSPKDMVERATVQGLTVTHVLNTHGHPDHTNGNKDLSVTVIVLISMLPHQAQTRVPCFKSQPPGRPSEKCVALQRCLCTKLL